MKKCGKWRARIEYQKKCYMLGHFDSKMSEAVLNAKDAESALEFLKDLEVRPEVMKRAIENPISGLTLPDILEKNRKEVIYDIKQQVNSSLMNGDRYEIAAEKLVERLDFSYGKAANIVRTETHRVTESGFMDCAKDISESLEDSEFVYAAIWHNMNDERVRPQQRYHTKSGWKTSKSKNGANHQKMEGKIIQVGDKFQLEPGVYAECPGNSGTARNDCRCRCFLEYTLLTKEEFLQKGGKLLDKSGESGIIEREYISGALNPDSNRAQEHADRYYESVRHMKTDIARIAKNTGFNENDISHIKDFIFIQKHDLGGSESEYFYPSYEMAQSWQRLIDGKNIQKHDITLLHHETMERKLMQQGYSQSEAHEITEQKYNYSKESKEYYAEINKHHKK